MVFISSHLASKTNPCSRSSPRSFSHSSAKTPSRACFAIPFTAATPAWSAGNSSAFPARKEATTTKSTSITGSLSAPNPPLSPKSHTQKFASARMSHEISSRGGRRHHRRRLVRPAHGQGTRLPHFSLRPRSRTRPLQRNLRLRQRHGRVGFRHPPPHDAGSLPGHRHISPQRQQARLAASPTRFLLARRRRRRFRRTLERPVPPFSPRLFRIAVPHHRKIRRQVLARRPCHPRLGRYLRRARAFLHPRRQTARHLRQSRQSPRTKNRRRQHLRRLAQRRISHPTHQNALLSRALPRRRQFPRLSPLPRALRQHQPDLYQSGWHLPRWLHLLRFLRKIRLHGRRQGSAHQSPSPHHPKAKKHCPAHRRLGPPHPLRRRLQARRPRRHLHRRSRRGSFSARVTGNSLFLDFQQHSPAPSLRDWRAL